MRQWGGREREREREMKREVYRLTKSVHHFIQPASTFTTGGALERQKERGGGGGAWEMSHTISIRGIPGME